MTETDGQPEELTQTERERERARERRMDTFVEIHFQRSRKMAPRENSVVRSVETT